MGVCGDVCGGCGYVWGVGCMCGDVGGVGVCVWGGVCVCNMIK